VSARTVAGSGGPPVPTGRLPPARRRPQTGACAGAPGPCQGAQAMTRVDNRRFSRGGPATSSVWQELTVYSWRVRFGHG
jgi:hypothetical protein